MAEDVTVEVEGRRLTLRNLDKVLYPATGTTKGEVLAYYTTVAAALLPQLRDRPLTRKRWPDGVAGPSFFEKNLPGGTPEWVARVRLPVPGTTRARETIDYPVAQDLATLVWLAHLAAIELHTPQWRVDPATVTTAAGVPSARPTPPAGAPLPPDRLVIDLDPGPPAGLRECSTVAVAVRDRLVAHGLSPVPVTSGSKGMQLYAPLPPGFTDEHPDVGDFAHALADDLAAAMPKLVLSRMTVALRPNKVLLDWSQNHPTKTTITPYSLRGRERPTVAAPRHWHEVEAAADGGTLAQLDHSEVAARLAADGDLLA
jgi:bifunctional non-homologous end joining protein LigD